ncbi:LOW QUALITY PROTEIN: TMV resistance protein N [Jatropha curcas]|uniref:LOW QUALITY PROTEIN: TMV resistance protein N n=1 Tax=Jatropha curcas TaxID=180498 RepID=UPI001894E82F|nr:LOW QUALITY PROTEIN: TMV resistance protein N [Jatropha curcas]
MASYSVASSSKAAEAGTSVSATADVAAASRVWRYDVFLSFRGEDVRNSFVSHLYKALTEKGIKTCKDDVKLDKGETIAPSLLQAIEDSRFCVVVFSKNYADSTFCLDELGKIIERIPDPKKDTKTDVLTNSKTNARDAVLPIFYDVDPSEVRKQTGVFGEGFAKSKLKFPEKVERWTLALTKAGNISGWDARNREEAILIDEIAICILGKLSHTSTNSTKGLVGMDFRVREMESKLHMGLDNVLMVGIWGMGGIGKTTIAKAVYDRIYGEFECCCFLQGVTEVASKPGLGLSHLQEQLLSKLLKEGIQKIRTLGDNFDVIKNRFQYMRVLIVLDDVDDIKQLRALAREHEWLLESMNGGPGSRIIITTRDKHLLEAHGVDQRYEAPLLNDNESLTLFTQHAFKNHCYSDVELNNISKPSSHTMWSSMLRMFLSLEVLGCHLAGKNELEWLDELHQLEMCPPKGINDVLKISFDRLDNRFQRDMFLDIACFFKGEDKDYVVKVFEGCGFFPHANLRVLIDKSLISILDNKLWMHDLVQQMGWEIVRQPETDPGKWTRLWDHNDVLTSFANNTVAEVVGIILDLSKIENLHINTEVFERMTKLRLLKVCYAHKSGGFEYLIQSNDEQSFDEEKKFDKLKFIKLSHSQKLIRTPDFTGMPNLEIIILQGCTELTEVHSSLSSLLKLLNLKDCSNLQNFPSEIRTSSLEILILSGCSKLQTFPAIKGDMDRLSELYLDDTAIQALPPSIEKLTGLVLLSARNCAHLQLLPCNFGNGLKHLRTIYFSGCSHLNQLLEKLEKLENLEELDVGGTKITHPPLSICSFVKLKMLSFHRCEGFPFVNIRGTMQEELDRDNIRKCFFRSLSYLTSLDLSYCNLDDVSIPTELGMLYSLKKLNLSGNNFSRLPPETIANYLEVICLADCNGLSSLPPLPCNIYWIEAPNCPELVSVHVPKLNNLCMMGFNFINCFRLGNGNATTIAVELLRQLIRKYGPDFESGFIQCELKLISDTGIVLNRSYEIKGDHVWLRFIPSCTLKLIRGSSTQLKAVILTHGNVLRVKNCGLFPMFDDCKPAKMLIEGRSQKDELNHQRNSGLHRRQFLRRSRNYELNRKRWLRLYRNRFLPRSRNYELNHKRRFGLYRNRFVPRFDLNTLETGFDLDALETGPDAFLQRFDMDTRPDVRKRIKIGLDSKNE